jgi:hypothetical protein
MAYSAQVRADRLWGRAFGLAAQVMYAAARRERAAEILEAEIAWG